VVAKDLLAFTGIAPPTLRLYPIETHIAEKLHAYTMPRSRPNSRVKDLPHPLLATAQPLISGVCARPSTDPFRTTHTCQSPSTPAWSTPYAAMAREDALAGPLDA
jgi:hypothetical protein